jgi:hypothetical protein
MPTTKARKSGSKKLSAKRGTTAGLAGIVAALDRNKIQHNILIRGIPIPDVIKGTITAASPGQAGTALGVLLNVKNIQYKPVKLFPRGIPVPDDIRFEIEGKLVK